VGGGVDEGKQRHPDDHLVPQAKYHLHIVGKLRRDNVIIERQVRFRWKGDQNGHKI